MLKKLLFGLLSLCSLSITLADVNLSVETLVIPSGTGVYQGTNPSAVMIIRNNGTDAAVPSSSLATGFITCKVGSDTVFLSNLIPQSSFRINPKSQIRFPLALSNLASQKLGAKDLSCTISSYGSWTVSQSTKQFSYVVLERKGGRFDTILDQVRDPLKNKIDGPVAELGKEGIKSFVYSLLDRFAVRAAAIVGVLFALLALYKIMFKSDEDSLSKIKGLLIWGIVGMVIILSSKFIGYTFYNDIVGTGEIGPGSFSTIDFVAKAYDLIAYPLLKIAFYIMMSVLFVILLIRVFSFVHSDQEEVRKKSMNIIVSTVVGLFIIISSKQLVEGVYGKEEAIRNANAVTVTDVGSSFLSNANIPILYSAIQWVMGLSGFIVLALIVFQTFKMLTNPTDEENISSIRKTLLYVIGGMLVIGAGYLIVNVVMVN